MAEIEHPAHYNWFEIECMDVAQHFPFHLGNAIKYIWRAGHKDNAIDDLEKARYSIQKEIERLRRYDNPPDTSTGQADNAPHTWGRDP